MRLWGMLAVVAWAWAGPARAEDAWRSELRLDVPVTAQAKTPLALAPELTGSWYFQRLIDDETQPLALLGFYQHPDTLTASLGATGPTLHGTLSGVLYPWRETGFTASLMNGINGGTATLTATYSAGIIQYFSQSFRTELQYIGTRVSSGLLEGSGKLSVNDSASDKGRVTVNLLLGKAALLAVYGEFGTVGNLHSSVEASGPGTTVTESGSSGTAYVGHAAITGFAGRSLSGTFGFGVRGNQRTVTQGQTPPTRELSLFTGPSAQIFLTEAAYLHAAYEFEYGRSFNLDTNTATTAITHQFTLTFGGRF